MNTSVLPCAVSQNTAAALTGRSVRTWQRRVEQGLVPRLGDGKTLVPFAALAAELTVTLCAEDLPLLTRADQGDAQAQADMGASLAQGALGTRFAQEGQAGAMGVMPADEARRGKSSAAAAAYFLQAAADQGQADAMHWLALLHAAGLVCGGDDDQGGGGKALALMWLARAAAHGHAIAREQLAALMPQAQRES